MGSSSRDPLVDPETDVRIDKGLAGKPYLVPGQTIDIGLAKFNPAERPPAVKNSADPLRLVNRETITSEKLSKTTLGLEPLRSQMVMSLVSGDHVILYYVASSDKEKDTFFKHGLYVLDTTSVLSRLSIPVFRGSIVLTQ